eukprot:scaffold7847_cov135-Isochrysis_galbana.AAC.3
MPAGDVPGPESAAHTPPSAHRPSVVPNPRTSRVRAAATQAGLRGQAVELARARATKGAAARRSRRGIGTNHRRVAAAVYVALKAWEALFRQALLGARADPQVTMQIIDKDGVIGIERAGHALLLRRGASLALRRLVVRAEGMALDGLEAAVAPLLRQPQCAPRRGDRLLLAPLTAALSPPLLPLPATRRAAFLVGHADHVFDRLPGAAPAPPAGGGSSSRSCDRLF